MATFLAIDEDKNPLILDKILLYGKGTNSSVLNKTKKPFSTENPLFFMCFYLIDSNWREF
jgi:hypothetical protein